MRHRKIKLLAIYAEQQIQQNSILTSVTHTVTEIAVAYNSL
jgi:hypothetical protein